jgi:predicted RNA methylase
MSFTVDTPRRSQAPIDVHGMRLVAETRLQLAPGLRTRLDAAGHVLVDSPVGAVVDLGPDGFSILALLSRTRTRHETFAALAAQPQCDLKPAMTGVNQLVETGALVEAGSIGVRTGWANPVEHARMLHDIRRTSAYVAAIDATVRPDDVVLDLGTGSGVLAVAAARAGARHVYAVEASDIGAVAAEVFEANGVADRVTLVSGWSMQVDLPERATLLVSELIGSDPFEEDVLDITLDARQRLLTADARLVPRRLELHARPLAVPAADRRECRIDSADVAEWNRLYAMDFGPLQDVRSRELAHWPTEPTVVATWPTLGPAVELASVDLASFTSPVVNAQAELVVQGDGSIDAVLLTFRAELYDQIEYVHEPRLDELSCWASSVWFLPKPIEARAGARLRVEYRRRVPGRPDGLVCADAAG